MNFDTVYAMADESEDKVIGLNSSAISLGGKSLKTVSLCYFLTCIFANQKFGLRDHEILELTPRFLLKEKHQAQLSQLHLLTTDKI